MNDEHETGFKKRLIDNTIFVAICIAILALMIAPLPAGHVTYQSLSPIVGFLPASAAAVIVAAVVAAFSITFADKYLSRDHP